MMKISNTYKKELGVIPLVFQEQEKLGRMDEAKASQTFLGNILDKLTP